MTSQIIDVRLKGRLASAAAAAVITAMMLVCVGLGFAGSASAREGSLSARPAEAPLAGRFE